MTDTLQAALLITAIGMGLVFAVILLLWALIAVIVRAAADRSATGGEDGDRAGQPPDDEASARARAVAVAAVAAVAVARQREQHAGDVKARAAAAAVGAYLADEQRKR